MLQLNNQIVGILNEEEKGLLNRISILRLEAKENLRMLSFLSNEKDVAHNKAVDYWLDKLAYLDELEKEIRSKSKK